MTVVHCRREKYDILIDRTTRWGNPIKLVGEANRLRVLQDYRRWLNGDPEFITLYGPPPTTKEIIQELWGKVLGCWCHPKPCHGDILAEIANA